MNQYDSYATRTLERLRSAYAPDTQEYQRFTELILLARYGNKCGISALRELRGTLAPWAPLCTNDQVDRSDRAQV